MKIEIKYENEILKSYSKKPISIKDIILNIKRKCNIKKEEILLVFNSKNNEIYEETDLLIPNKKEKNQIESLNIIKINNKKNIININNNNKPKENEPIEDLIMKVTGADKKLQSNNIKLPPPDLYDHNLNLNRLLQLLQALEQRNIIIEGNANYNINNNVPVEVNESYLNELKDMGFPEDRARQALITSRNNMNRATEILLDEGGE